MNALLMILVMMLFIRICCFLIFVFFTLEPEHINSEDEQAHILIHGTL
jgi:hypothetical protein